MKRGILIALMTSLAVGSFGDEAHSVLFVGNSLTFFNDLPRVLADLAAANGRQIEVASAVRGGETLKGHAGRRQTLDALRSQDWDIVVMQGHSIEPIVARAGMIAGGKRLAELCPKERNIAYMTWAYRSKDVFKRKLRRANMKPGEGGRIFSEMQERLADGYRALAEVVGGEVAPVGLVWSRARKDHPEWKLFKPDGLHPAPTGTYLATLVFYRTIYGEIPKRRPANAPVNEEIHEQMLTLLVP